MSNNNAALGLGLLPWASVCWLPAAPSRSPSPELPWRRCACARVRWGCACRRVRRSCLWTVPPHGCAARGWRRPGAPDGPRCDFAAGRQEVGITTLFTSELSTAWIHDKLHQSVKDTWRMTVASVSSTVSSVSWLLYTVDINWIDQICDQDM